VIFVFVAERRKLFCGFGTGLGWFGFSLRSNPWIFTGICIVLVFGNFGLEVQGKASLLFTPSRKAWSELLSAGLVLRSSSGLVLCKKKMLDE
jgi:hypothetical protein